AQISVGDMYAKGEGVSQDFIEAYKWLNIAAASPEKQDLSAFPPEQREAAKRLPWLAGPVAETAKADRDKLAKQMTPEQIAEGQRLSREFKTGQIPPSGSDASHSSIIASRPEASGTGFFISEDGFLVTN